VTTMAAAGPTLTWNLWSDVREVLTYPFMVNALEAATITAITAGVIGWFMILRRQSFVGHTLSVVSFPGASGAIWLGLPATLGYFGFCVGAALLIALVPRSLSGAGFAQESAVIGTVQAFSLASGFLFVSLYQGFLNGTTGLLFGSILGVTRSQVLVLLAVSAVSLALLAAIARPLFFASVDPAVASARGVPVQLLSTTFLVLLGVAAAETSQITGALLVFALLVMPAAAAQQLALQPAMSLAATMVIGLLVTWIGLGVSYFSTYPVGFFVPTFGFAAYVLALTWRRLADRAGRVRSARLAAVGG
jgi:zinc/manganese transport system permease protein